MKLHQETVAGLHTYADGTIILNTQLEKTETLNSLKV